MLRCGFSRRAPRITDARPTTTPLGSPTASIRHSIHHLALGQSRRQRGVKRDARGSSHPGDGRWPAGPPGLGGVRSACCVQSKRDVGPLGGRTTPLFASAGAPLGAAGRGQKAPARSPQAACPNRPNSAPHPSNGSGSSGTGTAPRARQRPTGHRPWRQPHTRRISGSRCSGSWPSARRAGRW